MSQSKPRPHIAKNLMWGRGLTFVLVSIPYLLLLMAFAALLSPRLRSAHYKHFLSETISTANSLRRRTSRSQVHSALSSDSSKWRSSSNVHSTVHHFSSPSDLLEFSPHAAGDVDHFRVFPGFITSEEEQGVVKEITRALRGKKYQYDHWDRVSYVSQCSAARLGGEGSSSLKVMASIFCSLKSALPQSMCD